MLEQLSWPVIMQSFEKIGYNGWASAEVAGGDSERFSTLLKNKSLADWDNLLIRMC